ncbi:MAG: hypothetical protein Q4E33_05785 [Erysipelotrichaceae bacterium]|nr:hypothetical protein [Erysipelotrichaceae bacterium]
MHAMTIAVLVLNLFIGSAIPSECLLKINGEVTEEITSYYDDGDGNNDNFFYAEINGGDSFTKIDSGSKLVAGKQYAILFHSFPEIEISQFAIEGYREDAIDYTVLNLKSEDGDEYEVDYDGLSEVFYVVKFYAPYQVNSVSIDGINMYADEELTRNYNVKLNIENCDPIEVSSGAVGYQSAYIDADSYDESGNMDPVDNLEPGKRYYFIAQTPPVEDKSESILLYNNSFIKADNFKVTINGKTAKQLDDSPSQLDTVVIGNPPYYVEFIANEKTKQTDIIYSIPESYEWAITNYVDQDVNKGIINVLTDKGEDNNVLINVKVTKADIKKTQTLTISVDSKNEWNMADVDDETNTKPYSIKVGTVDETGKLEPTENVWTENTPIIKIKATDEVSEEKPVVSKGIFTWSNGEPEGAGTYKDTLTFTAELKTTRMPIKGEQIKFDTDGDGINETYTVIKNVDGLEKKTVYEVMSIEPLKEENGEPKLMQIGDGESENVSGVTYKCYRNSDLDKYLNGENDEDYYKGLSSVVKEAIVPKTIYKNNYFIVGVSNFNEVFRATIINLGDTSSKNVYILNAKDLKDYTGYDCKFSELDDIAKQDINDKISNLYLERGTTSPVAISTQSANVAPGSGSTFRGYLSIVGDKFNQTKTNQDSFLIYPAFQIDLSMIDFENVN